MQTGSGILISFFGLFIALDTIGLLPGFNTVNQGMPVNENKKQFRSVYMALAICLGLLIFCRIMSGFLGLATVDFQIGGGIGLFVLSIFYLLNPDLKKKLILEIINIFPLTAPLMIGPSVIIMMLVLMSSYGLIITIFSFAVNMFFVDMIFKNANKIQKSLSDKGVVLLSKTFDIFLCVFAIMLIRKGLIALCTQFCAGKL